MSTRTILWWVAQAIDPKPAIRKRLVPWEGRLWRALARIEISIEDLRTLRLPIQPVTGRNCLLTASLVGHPASRTMTMVFITMREFLNMALMETEVSTPDSL
jgi:hypothetical protein